MYIYLGPNHPRASISIFRTFRAGHQFARPSDSITAGTNAVRNTDAGSHASTGPHLSAYTRLRCVIREHDPREGPMTEKAEKYPFGSAEGLVPHPRYTELRTARRMARIQTPWGDPAWLATRYDDVRLVLADPRFSRALAAGREDVARARPFVEDPRTIMATDPPAHTRLRRLV